MHRTKAAVFIVLASIVSAPSWCVEWSAAPAAASQSPEEAKGLSFVDLGSETDLTGLLVGDEGWYWLKAVVRMESDADAVLIGGPRLGWFAWWNGRPLVESGSGPPWWRPSSSIPSVVPVPEDSPPLNVLLIKTYVRQGFESSLPFVVSGPEDRLRQAQLARTALDLLLPGLLILLGVILFLGRLAAFATGRSARDLSLSLFGLAMAVGSLEPVLALFPFLAPFVPWTAVAVLAKASLPPAISLWRRCVANSGGKEPAATAVVDLVLAIAIAAWSAAAAFFPAALPAFAVGWTEFDVLPWYAAASLAAALISWISGLTAGKRSRLGSLLILLAAAAPGATAAALGETVRSSIGFLVEYGLPLAVLIGLLLGADRRTSAAEAALPDENEDDFAVDRFAGENEEDAVELEPFDEPDDAAAAEPLFDAASAAEPPSPQRTADDERLLRGLRSNLSPDSLPWDPYWDLAATRQGTRRPATGFHDVYVSGETLQGFTFMDAGKGDVDAMTYANVVRGELNRRFASARTLAGLARTINRRTLDLAAASGRGMTGVIGTLGGEDIRFLPLSLPPILLRKSAGGKIVTLQPAMGRASNPPLGAKGFGDEGLRTLSVRLEPGDALVAYTPSLIEIASPSYGPWGLRRLAAAVKSSESARADGLVADIIESLKDFAGTDTLGVALQILVVRRR